MSDTLDKEFEVLETIHSARENNLPVVQRDIAHIIGASLGMTNAIIKRLVKKGFLIIKKVNNRNIHYVVSPAGMKAITEKSYRYFKRTIKNVVYYKEKIENIVAVAEQAECTETVLIGESDLDFIVEHFCLKYGLAFTRKKPELIEFPEPGSGKKQAWKSMYIVAETVGHEEDLMTKLGSGAARVVYLRDVIMNG